jgi:hypothetical protein
VLPLRHRRRLVPKQESVALSRNAPAVDLDAFWADRDVVLDQRAQDVYRP